MIENKYVIRILLHFEFTKGKEVRLCLHFFGETKFRLIDDSKAQFENDVAENSPAQSADCFSSRDWLSCKCAFISSEKNTFVCFSFKDIYFFFAHFQLESTCSEI